jgi:hypothetical protein
MLLLLLLLPVAVCTHSFAVTAMAEAAVARQLNLPGGQIRMSVQDVAFCPEDPRDPRDCKSQWQLTAGIAKFLVGDVVVDRCLPYTAAKDSRDGDSNCK